MLTKKRTLITFPATQRGFTIGDRVEFTERSGLTVFLQGVGTVVGFSKEDGNCIVVQKESTSIHRYRMSLAWSGFYPEDPRELRPFAVGELRVLKPAASKLSGKPGNVILVDDLASRKPGEFKAGDLIKRTGHGNAPDMYGVTGEVYTVQQVDREGHPRLKETSHYANKLFFELVKTAEQSAWENLIRAEPREVVPVPQPKAKAYRVLSADGKTASSRTWDRYEDALKDASARAERDPDFREYQVVSVLTKAKAEKIAVTKYTRGPVVVNKVA